MLEELLSNPPVLGIKFPLSAEPPDLELWQDVVTEVESELLDNHLGEHHRGQVLESSRISGVEEVPSQRQVVDNAVEYEEPLRLMVVVHALILVVLIISPLVDQSVEHVGDDDTDDRVADCQALIGVTSSCLFAVLYHSIDLNKRQIVLDSEVSGHNEESGDNEDPVRPEVAAVLAARQPPQVLLHHVDLLVVVLEERELGSLVS